MSPNEIVLDRSKKILEKVPEDLLRVNGLKDLFKTINNLNKFKVFRVLSQNPWPQWFKTLNNLNVFKLFRVLSQNTVSI